VLPASHTSPHTACLTYRSTRPCDYPASTVYTSILDNLQTAAEMLQLWVAWCQGSGEGAHPWRVRGGWVELVAGMLCA